MQEDHFYFFSYGSNLLLERIQRRTPSVKVVRVHILDQYELIFNKLSIDGSTKANLQRTTNESGVYGVIHKILRQEKYFLDRAEGLGMGYNMEFFETEVEDRNIQVVYYIATDTCYLTEGVPYTWYRDYVYYGAIQNQFPNDYIAKIQSIPFSKDPDIERSREHDLVLSPFRAARIKFSK